MRRQRPRGVVNVLAAEKLVQSPALYSTFLLWLLSELLFEQLPEAGDLDKPKLVFFDEAHLLFTDSAAGADRQGRTGRAPDPL